MSILPKYLLYVILVLAFCLIGVFAYFGFYSKEIVEGDGFGYSIRMSQSDAFVTGKSRYEGSSVYIMKENSEGIVSLTPVTFSDEDFVFLKDQQTWKFYFDSRFRSSIKLQFNEHGELIRIYRSFRLFDPP